MLGRLIYVLIVYSVLMVLAVVTMRLSRNLARTSIAVYAFCGTWAALGVLLCLGWVPVLTSGGGMDDGVTRIVEFVLGAYVLLCSVAFFVRRAFWAMAALGVFCGAQLAVISAFVLPVLPAFLFAEWSSSGGAVVVLYLAACLYAYPICMLVAMYRLREYAGQ